MTEANGRRADHPINALFLERWSPRAFTGEAISRDQLFTLIEAARWAPSSYNSQPWRFLYACRDTPAWDGFLGLLTASNQSWAKNAAAIVIVVSKSTFARPGADTETVSHTASYDTGAAWASLALQAFLSGWAAHGIAGFDRERAASELKIPVGYRVEAGIVIGRQGDRSILPEALAAREVPSNRRPLAEIAFEGGFEA